MIIGLTDLPPKGRAISALPSVRTIRRLGFKGARLRTRKRLINRFISSELRTFWRCVGQVEAKCRYGNRLRLLQHGSLCDCSQPIHPAAEPPHQADVSHRTSLRRRTVLQSGRILSRYL